MLTLCLLTALAAPPTVPFTHGLVLAEAPAVVAPAETPTEADVPGLVQALAQAVRDKDWALVVAFAVMLLVALGNFALIKIGILSEENRKLALPWMAAISACLVTFASTLIAGGGWFNAVLYGFALGAGAVGLWEMVLKHVVALLSKPKP